MAVREDGANTCTCTPIVKVKLDLAIGNADTCENTHVQFRFTHPHNQLNKHTPTVHQPFLFNASTAMLAALPNSAVNTPQPAVVRVQEFITHNPTLKAFT